MADGCRAQPPRLYTADDGWVAVEVQGMGIAQLRRQWRRLPRGVPDQPGRERSPDPRGGPVATDVPRHGTQAAASPRRGHSTGGDPLPSTAWHPEFQDVNNDGFIDLLVTKGNVDAAAGLRRRATRRTSPRSAGRHVRRGRRRGRHPRLRAGPRGGPRRLQPRWPARPRRGLLRGPGPRLAQHGRGGGAAVRPSRHTGSMSGRRSRAPTTMPSAPGSRSRSAISTLRRELNVGGGHAGGQLGWAHFGLGPANAAEVRVLWPDGEHGAVAPRRQPTSS